MGRAEIADRKVEPALDLAIGVLRQTYPDRHANAFEPRSDIHALAHQIAVRLLDHVAKVDAYAELDAALGLHASIAVDEANLHLNGAAHCVHDAAELDDDAVPGALDDAAVMGGDGGVDEVAPEPPQPRQGAVLVSTGEPAVSDNVGDQDCCEFPGLGHSSGTPAKRMPS